MSRMQVRRLVGVVAASVVVGGPAVLLGWPGHGAPVRPEAYPNFGCVAVGNVGVCVGAPTG